MTSQTSGARWWLPCACAALLLLTWGGALDAPFIADDFAHARHALGDGRDADLRASLTGSWHGQGPPYFYRPLAVLSFALDGALYGVQSTGWHVTSFLLFFGAALLLAGATRAVLARAGFDAALAARAGAIAALTFCVLPSQLEAIAWISNRDGPLGTLFGLAAVWWWTRDRRLAATLAAALALCAKETAVSWLLLAVALSWLFARREQPGRALQAALRRSLPMLLVLGLYFAARRAMFGTFGTGQQDVFAHAGEAGGAVAVAGNVLVWLRLFVWPVAGDLLGGLAVPLGCACVVLACAPWWLAWRDAGALPRRALAWTAACGVGTAVLLLGPIVLVAAGTEDLGNSRFVPFVALPLCAASGLAWAVALGGRFRRLARGLLALLLALHVFIGSIHAGAFALVARDLQTVRATVIGKVEDGSIDPARLLAPVMLLDPPATGPAAFTLINVFHDMLYPPFTRTDIPMRMLSSDEFAIGRLLPEFRPMLESGSLLLPPGEPAAPTRPLQKLADQLRRFERLGVAEPRLVRRDRPAAQGAPDLSAPFDALDLAALRVVLDGSEAAGDAADDAAGDGAGDARGGAVATSGQAAGGDSGPVSHDTLRVEWTGTRGSGAVEFRSRQSPAIVPLEAELDWLASGVVTSLHVSGAGGAIGAIAKVEPLSRLPAIVISQPQADLTLGDDPRQPLEIVFRPPFPCERYRFRLLVLLAPLGDTFEAGQLALDAEGAVHLIFQDGKAGGRRTSVDWGFVKTWARDVRVRWLIEGIDGEGAAARVVARSAIRELKLRDAPSAGVEADARVDVKAK